MEPDKEYIRLYLLVCFHQKKTADAHRIICETYDENVWSLKRVWFKRFKNGDFDVSDKK